MDEISKYCQRLLISNECVILPGFGALIARDIPSQYSKEIEEFVPPGREITFNRNIRKDDGLLAHALATGTGISFTDARTTAGKWITSFTDELESGKRVRLEGLGSFHKNRNGAVLFLPDAFGLIHPNYYGFPTVQVAETPYAERMEQVKNLVSAYRPRLAAVAAGIALFFTFSIIPLPITHQSKVQQQQAIISINDLRPSVITAETDSVAMIVDEMTKKENALAPENEIPAYNKEPERKEEAKAIAEQTVVTEVKAEQPISDKQGFYLIAGSFVEMWRAEKYMEELKANGFSPVVVNSDNKIRIAVGYNSNRTSAESALAEHREKHPDRAVWILKK